MKLRIRIFDGDSINDVVLNENNKKFSIGSGINDNYRISSSDIIESQIVFNNNNGEWTCSDNKSDMIDFSINDGMYIVLSKEKRIAVGIYTKVVQSRKYKLEKKQECIIGRSEICDFQLKDRSVSSKHAKVFFDELGFCIEDLNSTNGTYLNNNKVIQELIKEGDIISVGSFSIRFRNSTLELFDEMEERLTAKKNVTKKNEPPVFKLSARMRTQMPSEVIEIKSPPNIGDVPTINWFSFLPMLATRSVYAVLFPIASILSTGISKKKYNKKKDIRLNKYEEYLQEVKKMIDKNRNDQYLSLEESNHETEQCFKIVEDMDRTLWERSVFDDDFIKIRVGKGTINTSFKIKFQDNSLNIQLDDLDMQGEELGKGNQLIDNAPILCDLNKNKSLGIVGEIKDTKILARNMIVQATTTHSYDDLKIVTIFPKNKISDWEFVKWLPHSFNDDRSLRYIADSKYSVSALEKNFEQEFKERIKNNSSKEFEDKSNLSLPKPHYLFFIADIDLIRETDIENYLDSEIPGVSVIYLCESMHEVPRSSNVIADIKGNKGDIFHKYDKGNKQFFTVDNTSLKAINKFARKMAPIKLAGKKTASDMPTNITFLEGYGVKRVEELNVLDNWKESNPSKSITAPIGIKENGEAFMFNMMYGSDFMKYHGPFGLVAGTNGSGKSEMMLSWILSLAIKYPPDVVSFIVVDYKGTGLLLPFEKLPHLAGKLSNIDGNIKRNIIAIEHEIKRRELLFDKKGIKPEIKEYYEHGFHLEDPLPVIIMVIDEFAEVKANVPEFIPILEKIFAVGRALGVWLVISTQKPGGVVTDKMYANTKFRWCCRVASTSDSKDMLNHPDAAKIKNAGRAYVQVGEDDIYEQVQSFWSGALYEPNKDEKLKRDIEISLVDITGKRIRYDMESAEETKHDGTKEIDAVVNHIRDIANQNGIKNSPKVWKEKLSNRIYLEKIINKNNDNKEGFKLNPIVGMVDDPYNQIHFPLNVDFTLNGHCILYGAPGTGKTTFLYTLIKSIADTYEPEDVNIYAMDFGSWSLSLFEKLPHIGGIANENEEEKIQKLSSMLLKELKLRKEDFSELGIINIEAYRKESKKRLPYIILIVDNFAPVLAHYPDLESLFLNIASEGGNYGIFLMITASTLNAVNYKIAQNVKYTLSLQLKDKADYSSIVGKTDGLEPEKYDGRGLIKGMPFALEFQTALPICGDDDNEVIYNLKKSISETYESWTGYRAKPIPIMPYIINYSSISTEGITLGLTCSDVMPLNLEINDTNYIIVSGQPGSGTSNILKIILKQAYEKFEAEINVFDRKKTKFGSIQSIVNRYFTDGIEFDNYVSEVSMLLDERYSIFEKDPNAKFKPIIVAIDSLTDMFEVVDNQTIDSFVEWMDRGKDLNIYLVMGDTASNINKMYSLGEPMTKRLVENKIAILTGGSFKEHLSFNSNMDYSKLGIALGEFEAYLLINNKNAIRYKSMYEY